MCLERRAVNLLGREDLLPNVSEIMSKIFKLFEILLQNIAVYEWSAYVFFFLTGLKQTTVLCSSSLSAVSCTLGSVGLLQISLEMVVILWN